MLDPNSAYMRGGSDGLQAIKGGAEARGDERLVQVSGRARQGGRAQRASAKMTQMALPDPRSRRLAHMRLATGSNPRGVVSPSPRSKGSTVMLSHNVIDIASGAYPQLPCRPLRAPGGSVEYGSMGGGGQFGRLWWCGRSGQAVG